MLKMVWVLWRNQVEDDGTLGFPHANWTPDMFFSKLGNDIDNTDTQILFDDFPRLRQVSSMGIHRHQCHLGNSLHKIQGGNFVTWFFINANHGKCTSPSSSPSCPQWIARRTLWHFLSSYHQLEFLVATSQALQAPVQARRNWVCLSEESWHDAVQLQTSATTSYLQLPNIS